MHLKLFFFDFICLFKREKRDTILMSQEPHNCATDILHDRLTHVKNRMKYKIRPSVKAGDNN